MQTMTQRIPISRSEIRNTNGMATVSVSPEIAKQWLSLNTQNRPLKDSVVLSYSKRMSSGQWMLNGQGIVFSKEGMLIDGQHRLAAVVKANKSIDFDVRFGVNSQAFETMDDGNKRSPSDVLAISGYKNNTQLASIVKKILANNNAAKDGTLLGTSNKDVLSFVQDNPEIHEVTKIACRFKYRSNLLSVADYGYFYWLFSHSEMGSEIYAYEFFDKLTKGSDLQENSPILVLIKRLTEAKLNSHKKITHKVKYAFIIKTWNKWINGECATLLRYAPHKEAFPTIL